MIKEEYIRFLKGRISSTTPTSVCKIANIVLNNFEVLLPLTTSQGQRAKKIAELAQNYWQQTPEAIIPLPESTEVSGGNSIKLTELSVGPFRGFSRQETFELDSLLTLLYGPNGTGKSSFCEALEYSLLGGVAEAESKRLDTSGYLRNAYTNSFREPVLTGVDTDGSSAQITPNENFYRFCFIEKNRIDNFSRIAAQAPAKQTELISTLFGLDGFNDFVRNFTSTLDDRHLDLQGQKKALLTTKRQSLELAQKNISQNQLMLSNLATESIALASKYKPGSTLESLENALSRTGIPNELTNLESELSKPVAAKIGLTKKIAEDKKERISISRKSLDEKQRELSAHSSDLSYKHLYDAVVSLSAVGQDECPACKTPVTATLNNPFILASQELTKLSHVSKLEAERNQLRSKLFQEIFDLHKIVQSITSYFPTENPLKIYSEPINESTALTWCDSLFVISIGSHTPWQHIEAQVGQIEQNDNLVSKEEELRDEKQKRLNHLRELERELIALKARKTQAQNAIDNANLEINSFNEQNKNLIDEVELEKATIERNNAIAQGYRQFVQLLNAYNNSLPGLLVADLSNKALELYNAFNSDDAIKDLIANIQLPTSQRQSLKISFQNDPMQFYDALHVLSEGHIRCLGLAILMAKNIKEDCPFLIFDDPVNAIDDEHRFAIRRTLFDSDYFKEKQVVLACHGEEFFKDIQNQIGQIRSKAANTYVFLPQFDENHIQVDFNCSSRNYILAAQEQLRKLEIRNALADSRRALEILTKNKIWRYVDKYGDGHLSLKFRSSGSPIELRNLTEQLKSKINKAAFSDPDKDSILEPLNTLLGFSGTSSEWRYLNKGTHEETDRSEFERGVVTAVVKALSDIDTALTQHGL